MNGTDHINGHAFSSCAVSADRVMLARDSQDSNGNMNMTVLGCMSPAAALHLAGQLQRAAQAASRDGPPVVRPLETARRRAAVFVGQSTAMP